jgi:hypothetical protein
LTSLEKSDTPILDSGYSGFDSFWLNIEKGGNTRRFEVQVCLSTEKEKKTSRRKKIKEVEAQSRCYKNRTLWFPKSEPLVFLGQI